MSVSVLRQVMDLSKAAPSPMKFVPHPKRGSFAKGTRRYGPVHMGTLKSGRNRCPRHRKKQILRSNFTRDRLNDRFWSFFFFSLLWFSQCPSCSSHSTPNTVISKCSVDTSQGSSSEGLSAASHASQNEVTASPESVLDCLLLSPAESDENRRWKRSTSSTLPFDLVGMYSVGTSRVLVSVLNVLGSSKYKQCLLIDKIDSFLQASQPHRPHPQTMSQWQSSSTTARTTTSESGRWARK
ncbi:uncharacterized protein CLUP02_11367 [Colletotrichum lupini]|uniref:Uncharacterized protein n=1 Tax=Colletotrichum lupini TaxID=145971 RepID=A0A9Q8WJF0_9PEZI|nr:uncharacterized protein CLUP02_11367 [Colletotrichum lupini]UQC85868.1 hypothetical protein CLUP02_11367 [Colletotrichum lupini]